jgi:hypothetical protein
MNTEPLEEIVNDLVAGDGYEAVVEELAEGRLRVEILAGPEACADCLVPKGVMKAILLDRLPPGTVLDEQDIVYPSDAGSF